MAALAGEATLKVPLSFRLREAHVGTCLLPKPQRRQSERDRPGATRKDIGLEPLGLTSVHVVHTMLRVGYEWDENKAAVNLRKHGIDFADAALVLEDDFALTIRDLYSQGEERFVTIGRDAQGRLLTVAYTWRGERIRLISARESTSKECRNYEKGRP